jgi:AraC-like DNA-binding protein
LEQIADELGYSDVANFSRAFKRWSGRSPSNWRKDPYL